MRKNIIYGSIALFTISKRHDDEVLMIAFTVCIHDLVALSTADRACRVNQLSVL
jgi:hypothetical protein